ncbi:hypothetical protein P3X46_016913 [Hevea brasiliensis]|uniref:Zinc knuckle CX2CX4HX4C domain-containing protein n=1 Tax=Hevea brasiliensis TaxID=3981 RepID=A0ABQ9M4J9_HEVBR|nr:hypothetical protein P3X46_016913 [Hevea brasiliensis]
MLLKGLWSFNKHLLVTHHLLPRKNPFDVEFHITLFWVQVHHVPVGYVNKSVAKLLGDFLMKFIGYDFAISNGGWKSYMHIKVAIDIRVLLKRSKKVLTEKEYGFIVHFQYERLPIFCFLCGLLGHNENYCEKLFDGMNGMKQKGWGAWL